MTNPTTPTGPTGTNAPAPIAGAVAADRFPPNSRYAATGVTTEVAADGTERRFLARRFVGPAETAPTLAQHLVVAGDRPDLIAAHYYGDPLLSWRIADANRALDPGDLTASPGDVLRITGLDLSGQFGAGT